MNDVTHEFLADIEIEAGRLNGYKGKKTNRWLNVKVLQIN